MGGRNAPPFYALEIDGTGRHRKAKEPERMPERLAEWQRFYNEDRPRRGLGGRTHQQRWEAVAPLTPTREEIDSRYNPKAEPTTVRRGNRIWVTSGK